MDDMMTPERISEINKAADSYHVGLIRKYAKELTGRNSAFADADLHMLACLTHRALRAGLTDGLPESAIKHFAENHMPDREPS